MDTARLIIAIVLSMLVFFVWDYFFVEKQKVKAPQQEIQAEKPVKPEQISTQEAKAPAPPKPLPVVAPKPPQGPARTITVDTPLYTVKISEKGAEFKSFILKKYRQTIKPESSFYEMIPAEMQTGTASLGWTGNSLGDFKQAVYSTDLKPDTVQVQDKSREIAFVWASPQGIVVEKQFVFSPTTYLIELNVVVRNDSGQIFKDQLALSLFAPQPDKDSQIGFEGPCALVDGKVEEIKIKKIKDQNVYPGKMKWIAIESRYFLSALIPVEPADASMRLFLEENKTLQNQYVHPERAIQPGSRHEFKHYLFLGPKSMKILDQIDYDLNKSVDFGMFDFLAKPLVWIMNFLYDHTIPNYGIAIIILTILTKIILWPLGNKSYKSMAEMKKIQPLMAEIKEKYGSDKKKMNEEMMSLYKTYKVNPLGGCLPMVVQIPVFFALYRMLYEAIELRHAPFVGWITDLSAPDRLFQFDFQVPFMQPPYGIPVLTIIMGATMLVQQRMSPPPGDPAQAKMMMLMPIVFTVIFINFSSGLVLYWLVNNILSIAQQYYVQKKQK